MDQSRQSGLTKLWSLLVKLTLYNTVRVGINTLSVKKLLEVIQMESKSKDVPLQLRRSDVLAVEKVESC